jgi:hypothetical protein
VTPTAERTGGETPPGDRAPDLGDLVVVLLAGTLAGLRDRLRADGFDGPAELVADLVAAVDDYLDDVPSGCDARCCG